MKSTTVTKIFTPNNYKLLEFFQEQGISREIIEENTKQIHYKNNNREYFGIGLVNQSGGYEIYNPYMKVRVGDTNISTIGDNTKEAIVFEEMTDMLSFLQICKDKNVQNNRTLIVLNSATNVDIFLDKFKNYQGKIHLILHGDKAGNEATGRILTVFQRENVVDSRYIYRISENGNQNLNDYLKNKIKNTIIQEKNDIFTQENKSLNNLEYEQVTIKSRGISTSESVGRESSESDDKNFNKKSESEQKRDNTSGLGMDSNDVRDGFSTSEQFDLGGGERRGSGIRTTVPSQQKNDRNTEFVLGGEYREAKRDVINRNDASDNRSNSSEFEIHQDSSTVFDKQQGGNRKNASGGDGSRSIEVSGDTPGLSFGVTDSLEIQQKISNLIGQKPTNDTISELVDVLTSVNEKGEILLNNGIEITNEIKNFVGAYKSGGITKDNRGILDEYYTDEKLVIAIRNLIKDKFNDKTSINVLEPSVGIGNFLFAVKDLGIKTNITAFEINNITAKIAKILNPEANINLRSFETEFITDNGEKKDFQQKYDLVIGNPPYGQHRGFYKGVGEEIKISRYEDYFVKRSLDVMKEGGTLAMVLPSGWLNRQKDLKNAELSEAFRLPNGVFKATDVGTDIIILRKNSNAQKQDISNYFDINEDKVLGEVTQKSNRFGKQEDYVKGNLENALQKLERFNLKNSQSINDSVSTKEALKQGVQLSLFDNFGQVIVAEKEEIKVPQKSIENNKKEINLAILKLTQALEVLENIKFKPISLVKQITAYTDLRADLHNKPEEYNKNSLLEITQKAENIINFHKDKKNQFEEYAVQEKPDIKKGILKYQFSKQDEIVETGLQNSPSLTQEQVKSFRDTYYNGSIYDRESNQKYANYYKGSWIHDFYYAEGDIYEKLEQLELDYAQENNGITPEQYHKQKALLENVLPKPKTLDEIIIAPNHEFVHKFHLGQVEKEKNWRNPITGRWVSEKIIADYSLADKFQDFVRSLPNEAFGESNSWEVNAYVRNEVVTGSDKERNAHVRDRRKLVAKDLFDKFIREELSDNLKARFVREFNRRYNNIHIPDYSQFPLFSEIYQNFKGKPLNLTEVQKAGIGRLTTKGVGLLAHEVGFGKTLSGVLSMHEAMERGNAKRPLIVVPNDSILKQWVETIFETIPNAKVNVLGNLGKDYDLSKFDNKDGEITLVTYEGFNNIGFKNDTIKRLAEKFSYVTAKDFSQLDTVEEKVREIEIGIAKQEETEGRIKRGKVYDWEDFGFDHLTFDEVHNANHIVAKVRIDDRKFASDFRNQQQRTSKLGLNTWVASQYIQEQNNGRNVTLLSATPFTNKPLEYYSVLSLIANERLEKSGYFNVNTFFETFMEADNDMEIDAKGDIKYKTNVRRFKNNALFQQLLGEYIDIKGEEDNPELKRPNRINKEYKIEQNHLTRNEYDNLNSSFDESKEGAILTHILNARLIAFSPYLSKFYSGEPPTMEEFVENSPKLKTTMELISQNKKDKPEAGQIIYSELAVAEFPKLKEYLVAKVGYKPNEVEMITGATSKNKRLEIQEKFNEGKIKVIIGSEAIQEGMNLQENTTDMYLLTLPYNFTSLRQTEGRAWRQGNKWENVRINFMLTNDSIDVFMLQKLQAKQSRYMEAMKNGANIIDVSDVDTQELKTAIITDPALRAKIEMEVVQKKMESEKSRLTSDLGFISRKFEKYVKSDEFNRVNSIKKDIENFSEWAKDGDEYWKERLIREKEALIIAEEKLQALIDDLVKKGVKVDQFQQQQKMTEDKISELERVIREDLPKQEKDLAQQYKQEKEERLRNLSPLNFVEERAKENKTFFKLKPIEEQITEKKSNQRISIDDLDVVLSNENAKELLYDAGAKKKDIDMLDLKSGIDLQAPEFVKKKKAFQEKISQEVADNLKDIVAKQEKTKQLKR
ncbi:Eco57I restriction-modification methylase domain-containing protein [Capnocytophaga canis]|uniref:Eco57I restriction-modification methylase domain-containing protein n=2 Tax=Capnocytophaga canis TaxID=1848903 RepID=UPI0015628145|nr:helicase-related protein [Capnocytophaga canis]